MLVDKIGKVVKSTPILRNLLFPVVTHLWREREERFRRYCRELPKLVLEPFFVKIGANDGITGDPCTDILLGNANWRGLLVEPVPYCFARLRASFPDSQRFRLEQVAIGASAGDATFYYVDSKARTSIRDLPPWFDQLGSFDRNHIIKHLDGVLAPFIVESKVQVCPLSEVLERNQIQDVHLLHIDTEGYDYEVLKTLDFAKHAPLSIFVEHKHLSLTHKRQMLGLLRGHGYAVSDCGEDYFAVNAEINRCLHRAARSAPR